MCCLVVSDSPMAPFLLLKLAQSVKFLYDVDNSNLKIMQELLGKKGNVHFLKQYWQFACVLKNGQVEQYIEQPFVLGTKILADTREKIYSNVSPENVLTLLTKK